MDAATITAWGTMLTGFAAIGAVLGGFITMRHQIKKANSVTWINNLRTESSSFISQVYLLNSQSTLDDLKSPLKTLFVIRLLLNQNDSNHRAVLKVTATIMENITEQDMADELKFKAMLGRLSSFIDEVEKLIYIKELEL